MSLNCVNSTLRKNIYGTISLDTSSGNMDLKAHPQISSSQNNDRHQTPHEQRSHDLT